MSEEQTFAFTRFLRKFSDNIISPDFWIENRELIEEYQNVTSHICSECNSTYLKNNDTLEASERKQDECNGDLSLCMDCDLSIKIKIEIEYVYNGWCFKGLGHTRCNPNIDPDPEQATWARSKYSHRVHIKINNIPKKYRTSYISIFAPNGFDVQHSKSTHIDKHYEFIFAIDDIYLNQELMVSFINLYDYDPPRPSSGSIRKIIHRLPITIPYPKVMGDTDSCNICLDTMTDKYDILLCGHKFHSTCIWEYCKSINLIIPQATQCKSCNHEDYVISRVCPICRNHD